MEMGLLWKLLVAAALIMMLIYLWPSFKAWQEHGPKAQKGDWPAVILPLVGVAAFVVFLIMIVR
jgi:nitric oxide reductase large subunit